MNDRPRSVAPFAPGDAGARPAGSADGGRQPRAVSTPVPVALPAAPDIAALARGPERRLWRAKEAARRFTREASRDVLSCAGCGKCCTREFNSVRVLPVEAAHFLGHLRAMPAARRAEIAARAARAVADLGLADGAPGRLYDCPLQAADGRCILPIHVKPLACLSFGPRAGAMCDLDLPLYSAAWPAVERANRALGHDAARRAIPVFLVGLGGPSPAPRHAVTAPRKPDRAPAPARPAGRRAPAPRRRR